MTTTAPQLGVRAGPIEATHVTGRRVVATLIDGFIFGVAYWLLALAFGDLRTEGEAANWAAPFPPGPASSTACSSSATTSCWKATWVRPSARWPPGSRSSARPPVPPPNAMVRTVLRLIDGLFCYAVAFFTALASAKRQRLGDMAARTLVIRV